jgi:hypothetical protein
MPVMKVEVSKNEYRVVVEFKLPGVEVILFFEKPSILTDEASYVVKSRSFEGNAQSVAYQIECLKAAAHMAESLMQDYS